MISNKIDTHRHVVLWHNVKISCIRIRPNSYAHGQPEVIKTVLKCEKFTKQRVAQHRVHSFEFSSSRIRVKEFAFEFENSSSNPPNPHFMGIDGNFWGKNLSACFYGVVQIYLKKRFRADGIICWRFALKFRFNYFHFLANILYLTQYPT